MQPVLLNQGVDTSNQLTDTIVVELREPLPPYALIQSSTHLLQRDGSVQCVWPPFVDTAYVVIGIATMLKPGRPIRRFWMHHH
ncbi:MAG: hypothetical protein HWD58_08460 [Bacteroidota bacterium]|nr:MAG: hypothetical protein HWD58_08460 [Bacteroidota bacterium]